MRRSHPYQRRNFLPTTCPPIRRPLSRLLPYLLLSYRIDNPFAALRQPSHMTTDKHPVTDTMMTP